MYYTVKITVPELASYRAGSVSMPLPLPMAMGTVTGYIQGILGKMRDGEHFTMNVELEAMNDTKGKK